MTDYRAQSKVNPRLKESLKAAVAWQKPELKTVRDQIDYRFRANEKAQFATEGASGGRRWPKLSPDYAKQKKRIYPGRKIMQGSGKMRKAFTNKARPHVATYATKPRPSVTVGADSQVAAYHIKPKAGVSNPSYNRKLPDRDVMQMTRRQEKGLIQIAWDYITEVKSKRAQRIMSAWAKTGRRSA